MDSVLIINALPDRHLIAFCSLIRACPDNSTRRLEIVFTMNDIGKKSPPCANLPDFVKDELMRFVNVAF